MYQDIISATSKQAAPETAVTSRRSAGSRTKALSGDKTALISSSPRRAPPAKRIVSNGRKISVAIETVTVVGHFSTSCLVAVAAVLPLPPIKTASTPDTVPPAVANHQFQAASSAAGPNRTMPDNTAHTSVTTTSHPEERARHSRSLSPSLA